MLAISSKNNFDFQRYAMDLSHKWFEKVKQLAFPLDTGLSKILYLALRGVLNKCTMLSRVWRGALPYFGVVYKDRLFAARVTVYTLQREHFMKRRKYVF